MFWFSSLYLVIGGFFLLTRVQSLNDGSTSTRPTVPTTRAREISPEWLSMYLSVSIESSNTNTNANINTNTNLLRKTPKHRNRNLQHKLLPTTGDVWRACSRNATDSKRIVNQNNTEYTESVYEYSTYDDKHGSKACTCFYDKQTNGYWAQCALNDQNCNTQQQQQHQQQHTTNHAGIQTATTTTTTATTTTTTGDTCTGTHEFFLFSDTTGDLTQKSSCNLCRDVANCDEGVQETCTLVAFDQTNARPSRCVLKTIHRDGSQTRCDDCTICRDDQTDDYGVFHNCFGQPTPSGTCDTSGTAHLHNFQPSLLAPNPGPAAIIGGTFGSLCGSPNPARALYGDTQYDDGYLKNCDCQDPTRGVIACDLFVEKTQRVDESAAATTTARDCFANECTELTELFYFDSSSGDMNEKMTCDYTASNDNVLCSIVRFSPGTGEPIGCSLFSSQSLDTCDECTICKNDRNREQFGIRYNCFGSTVDENTCLSGKGRAVYNLPPARNQSPPTPTPQQTTTTTQVPPNNNRPVRSDPTSSFARSTHKRNKSMPLILGISLGGGFIVLFSVVVIVVALSSGNGKENAREATTTSSTPPPASDAAGTYNTDAVVVADPGFDFATTETDVYDPPTVLVDEAGRPMVEDPTPIAIT